MLIQWKAFLTSDVVDVQELLEANRPNPSEFWTIRRLQKPTAEVSVVQ